MLQLFKKLKLYTKLGPEHIKVYLWSLVDYQHLQKYFYNWNITLNYNFICEVNSTGNFMYLEMLLIASNVHISAPLFRPLWKIVNDLSNNVPAVPVIMSFKVLKCTSSGKISFFLFLSIFYFLSFYFLFSIWGNKISN